MILVTCLRILILGVSLPISLGEYHVYSHGDWGASPAAEATRISKPVPYVVIHHTFIPGACLNIQDCMIAMKAMQNYHIKHGWGDIGYNFCVGGDGGVYEGRGWDKVGAHSAKANSKSVGICIIGNWTTEVPPVNQLDSTKMLIEQGVKDGHINPDYKLVGASQAVPTKSPGAALLQEISTWPHYTADQVN